METQLTTLYREKYDLSKKLRDLRNEYIKMIYRDILNNKPVNAIKSDLKRISMVNRVKLPELEKYALKMSDFFAKRCKNKSEDIIFVLFFKLLSRKKIFNNTNIIINEESRKIETNGKDKMLNQLIEINRNYKEPNIFYASSGHNDCAIDHKEFQNKIYVDEKWRELIKDEDLKKDIGIYIDLHDIKTFQWVIGRPVWLITRPNCRHYFKTIKTEEVLSQSLQSIIRRHKLHRKVARKEMASIRHDTRKVWYSRDNVESIIKKYEERYELHKGLYEVNRYNQVAKREMEKDKLLIDKWKKFYKTKFKEQQ
jgi:hypothetical protein